MSILSAEQLGSKKLRIWTIAGAIVGPLIVIVLSVLTAEPGMRIILVLIFASLAGMWMVRFVFAIKFNKSAKRKIGLGMLSLFTLFLVFLVIKWKQVSDDGGQVRQEPFNIAGNLYYVGTREVTSFLLTSRQGHVLIDGGYPGTADMIIKNIAMLGFELEDVKILLNSHAHLDHAGGLAALQDTSGAELWISEPDVELIESGGYGSRNLGLMNFLVFIGMAKYPAPVIDHIFTDGTKIRLDSIELTAHITPGHTPGCTSWAFTVKEEERELLVVTIGSLTLIPSSLFGQMYDDQLQHEFRESFTKLRSLPADIFLGSHASFFDMRRKLKERASAADKIAPFIDREGYLKYIDDAENELIEALADEK